MIQFLFTAILLSVKLIANDLPIDKKVQFFYENEEYKKITELCQIMNLQGSDKGGGGTHNYTTLYSLLFSFLKNQPISIFEMGLGTNYLDVPSSMGVNGIPGASLRGWAQFFPNAKIYGADIDSRILFNEGNISTFFCDQTDENLIDDLFSNKMNNTMFHIIIDDGLHEFDAGYKLLINAIQYLKKNGFYIIEDITPLDALRYQKVLASLQDDFKLSYINLLDIPPRANHVVDNKLLIIQK